VMGFLLSLQQSTFIRFLNESESIWAFPAILVAHTVGLALVVGTNAVVNLRILGASKKIPLDALLRLARVMWIGFGISVVSGIALFLMDPEKRAMETVFYIKLGLIALALVVTYMIRPVLRREPVAGQSSGAPAWAKALAGTSFLLWAAAIWAARLMALAT
jgi:hypothetical protein